MGGNKNNLVEYPMKKQCKAVFAIAMLTVGGNNLATAGSDDGSTASIKSMRPVLSRSATNLDAARPGDGSGMTYNPADLAHLQNQLRLQQVDNYELTQVTQALRVEVEGLKASKESLDSALWHKHKEIHEVHAEKEKLEEIKKQLETANQEADKIAKQKTEAAFGAYIMGQDLLNWVESNYDRLYNFCNTHTPPAGEKEELDKFVKEHIPLLVELLTAKPLPAN